MVKKISIKASPICYLTVILYLCGCVSKNVSNPHPVTLENAPSTPLSVKEDSVVFFSLSEAEVSSLSEDHQYEYAELADDFIFNIARIENVLHEHGFSTYATNSREIIFVSSEGKKMSRTIGADAWVAVVMFTKGKKPKIYSNTIVQDDAMLRVFKEYFGDVFSKY